jgi:two-component sensor histidine kinase
MGLERTGIECRLDGSRKPARESCASSSGRDTTAALRDKPSPERTKSDRANLATLARFGLSSTILENDVISGAMEKLRALSGLKTSRSQVLLWHNGLGHRLSLNLRGARGEPSTMQRRLSISLKPLEPERGTGKRFAGKGPESQMGAFCHYIFNSLQVVQSLIALYCDQDPEASLPEVSANLTMKLQAMGHIYRNVMETGDIGNIGFSLCLTQMVADFSDFLIQQGIEVNIYSEAITLPLDAAINCAIILSEVLHNVSLHAFPPGFSGPRAVEIMMQRDDGSFKLTIHDNGVGLPNDVTLEERKGIGMRLMESLAEQIRGHVEIRGDAGLRVSLEFPEATPEKGVR